MNVFINRSAAAPHWTCPPLWFEETRGGRLFCEKNKTTLAESDKGSVWQRGCARHGNQRGLPWLSKQKKRRKLKRRAPRRNQNGPAQSGPESFRGQGPWI